VGFTRFTTATKGLVPSATPDRAAEGELAFRKDSSALDEGVHWNLAESKTPNPMQARLKPTTTSRFFKVVRDFCSITDSYNKANRRARNTATL
jgi:hypothetical protein